MDAKAKRLLALSASLLLLSGCSQVMDPAGPVGAGEKTILLNSLAIMLCIVVPTIALTLWFAFWYREGNTKARYLPEWAFSGRVEAVVWAIPVLVILFLGGITWVSSHDLEPSKPLVSKVAPIDVQVVSLDWKWLFIYPAQGVATVNHLVIPAGTPVQFHITSASVMNAFFVPRLGSMIYAMNGMETKLHLQADQPGEFRGQSSHYSGDGFSGMHFPVEAVAPAQFAAWAAQAKGGAGPVLDVAGYKQLAVQSEDNPQVTYKAVQPGLFDAIVTQKLAPAPGPTSVGEAGVNVRPETKER